MKQSLTTVRLYNDYKKEYIMKVTNMKLAENTSNIRAFFYLTIGIIQTRNWKLKQKFNGDYIVTPPTKVFQNNGTIQHEPIINILDPNVKTLILKLAVEHYEKEVNFNDTKIEL